MLLIISLMLGACSTSAVAPETATAPSPVLERAPDSGATTALEPITAPQTIVIITHQTLQTLEPYHLAGMHPDESVAYHLWDTLVWINDDFSPAPMLAESWTLVNDQTWQFNLRQGVTFHNGEPFNAEAVRFSLERSASLSGSLETFYTDAHVEAIEVVDDYTVRIRTSKPISNLPYLIAGVEMLPSGYYSQTPTDLLATQPIGTGPYRVQSWVSGQPLVLEADMDYWQGAPLISTLIFGSEDTLTARLEALLKGEANLVADLTPGQAAEAETDATRFLAVESARRLFIGIRPDPGTPLADVQVRQALNYAINVDALIEEYSGGFGQRYGSWVLPPGANPELTPWPYDLGQARTLLTEAGYNEGFDVALDAPSDRYYNDRAITEAVAEQLAQIGVRVTVQSYDWESYVTDRIAPQRTAPLFLLALASRGDSLTDTENLSSAFPFNPTQWLNADFEELLEKARGTFNEQRRLRLLYQAQAIAYEEAPWIWLWRPYDHYAITRDLDWTPRADGLIYLYRPLPTGEPPQEESGK